MILDLLVYHHNPRSEATFKVEVQDHALRQLLADTQLAFRVYELMSIRRPGDV